MPPIDLHASNGLQNRERSIENNVRPLLRVEEGFVDIRPLLASAEIEVALAEALPRRPRKDLYAILAVLRRR